MYPELNDKTILITGASSGIGAGIARSLARHKTKIILHYNTNYNGVIQTKNEVVSRGSEAKIIQFDFRKEERVKQFFTEALSCFSDIDILINNAGVVPKRTIDDTDLEFWRETHSINLNFPFFLSREFARHRIETGKPGVIVNISSIHGEQSREKYAAYASTKSALNALTKIQAIEWAEHRIRVNTIAPGAVEVDRNKDGLRDNQELWMPKILLGRYGTTDEIGELAVFLSSDAAAWMTGQVLTIDGGTTARGNYPNK